MADPAVDLGLAAVRRRPEPFAEAVATAYGVTDEELARALDWHRLGPWYEVMWGQGPAARSSSRSGLARDRRPGSTPR